jgi:hypothetical protein
VHVSAVLEPIRGPKNFVTARNQLGLAPGKVGFAGSVAIGHEICGHVLLPI